MNFFGIIGGLVLNRLGVKIPSHKRKGVATGIWVGFH